MYFFSKIFYYQIYLSLILLLFATSQSSSFLVLLAFFRALSLSLIKFKIYGFIHGSLYFLMLNVFTGHIMSATAFILDTIISHKILGSSLA